MAGLASEACLARVTRHGMSALRQRRQNQHNKTESEYSRQTGMRMNVGQKEYPLFKVSGLD